MNTKARGLAWTAVAVLGWTAACTKAGDAPIASSAQGLTSEQCYHYQSNNKVTICHATGAMRNPIVKLQIATDACISAHARHPNDYIAVDGNCVNACLPLGAPCDATLGCCGGFACVDGVCGCPTGTCFGGGTSCEMITSDVENCGACGNVCPQVANGTAACVESLCGVGACDPGYHACTSAGPPSTTSCAPNDSTESCGASCTPCPTPPNATATCDGTSCGFTCSAGFADCDGNAANGCETDTRSNVTSCGACGNACPAVANGTAACSGSECVLASCDEGWHACTSAGPTPSCASNGSTESCGASCTPCPAPPNATATCDGTSCGFTCSAGFADCDGNAANGCEVNTENDSANCGACGTVCCTSCGGGTCSAAPEVLVSGQIQPVGIAVDAGHVYWTALGPTPPTNNGTVMKAGLDGSNPVVLATGQIRPTSITVDATHAYWVNTENISSGGAVMKVGLDGNGLTVLASNRSAPDSLVVDATHVYFPEENAHRVSKVAVGGGTITTLYQTTANEPIGIARDANALYFVDRAGASGNIHRLAFDGSSDQVLATDQNLARFVAVDADRVYWTANASAPNGYVASVQRDGNGLNTLASGLNTPFGLAAGGGYVYFAERVDTDGHVFKVPGTGGTPIAIASGIQRPNRVAVDARCVYFTATLGGQIYRVQK